MSIMKTENAKVIDISKSSSNSELVVITKKFFMVSKMYIDFNEKIKQTK